MLLRVVVRELDVVTHKLVLGIRFQKNIKIAANQAFIGPCIVSRTVVVVVVPLKVVFFCLTSVSTKLSFPHPPTHPPTRRYSVFCMFILVARY